MKVIKILAISLLGLILFFSLFLFGITFTVKQTALNPNFAVKILNDINFNQAIQETIGQQVANGNISPQLQTALITSLQNIEPVIKEQLSIAIVNTYAALKEQSNAPNLDSTLANSVVNAQFVKNVLDKIDLSSLLDQVVEEQIPASAGISGDFENALITAINASAPALKQQIINAAGPICQYLTSQTATIDLQNTLRQTLLSDSSVSGVLNNFDYTSVTKDILTAEIGGQLPDGIQLTSQDMDQLVAALQPSVKTAITNASGNIADYLMGTNPNFSIDIDLTPVMPSLKIVTETAFMGQLPGGLQGLPQTAADYAFEQYYSGFSQSIPATYQVNSSDLGLNVTSGITAAITSAQNSLMQAQSSITTASQDFTSDLGTARTYVGYFQEAFIGLIVLTGLVILGIVTIHRSIKASCRDLGVVFSLYGAGEFAGVLLIRNIGLQQLSQLNIPQALSNLPGMLLRDMTAPLEAVSLVCLGGGILLIVTSLLFPRLKPVKIEQRNISPHSKEPLLNKNNNLG
jgi:hypothetical protein